MIITDVPAMKCYIRWFTSDVPFLSKYLHNLWLNGDKTFYGGCRRCNSKTCIDFLTENQRGTQEIEFDNLDKDLKTKRLCLKISRKYRWEYEEAVWYRDEYKLLRKKKEKEKKEKKTRIKWNLKSFFDRSSSANPKKIDNDFIPVSDSQLEHQKIEHDKTQIQLQPKIHQASLNILKDLFEYSNESCEEFMRYEHKEILKGMLASKRIPYCRNCKSESCLDFPSEFFKLVYQLEFIILRYRHKKLVLDFCNEMSSFIKNMHGFKKFYEDLSNSKEKNETFHSNTKEDSSDRVNTLTEKDHKFF